MSNLKVKNKQLAKLREFRKGMDIPEYLETEFRQVLRALQNLYVSSDAESVVRGLTNYVESESSGNFSTTSNVDVPNLRVRITTTGGRVRVGLKSSGQAGLTATIGSTNTTGICGALFHIKQDGVIIATEQVQMSATGSTASATFVPSSSLSTVIPDLPAGTYEFTVSIEILFLNGIIRFSKLYAEELF